MKKRHIIVVGDVAYVPLTKGYTAIIDAADVLLVENRNWHAATPSRSGTVYARRDGSKGRAILLHRVILGLGDSDIQCDHKDGNGLNNRRSNLRECSSSQNKRNTRRRLDNTSGYKGVHWNVRCARWQAYIKSAGIKKHLGYFDTPEEAHAAYAAAAGQVHGTFARVA